MAVIKIPTSEQQKEAEDGYAILVGRVSLLWAKIHEDLAQIYIYRFNSAAARLAEADWYSHRSDSAQRELLTKTIERMDIRGAETFPNAKGDLLWSIGRINTLARIRTVRSVASRPCMCAMTWPRSRLSTSGPQISQFPKCSISGRLGFSTSVPV